MINDYNFVDDDEQNEMLEKFIYTYIYIHIPIFDAHTHTIWQKKTKRFLGFVPVHIYEHLLTPNCLIKINSVDHCWQRCSESKCCDFNQYFFLFWFGWCRWMLDAVIYHSMWLISVKYCWNAPICTYTRNHNEHFKSSHIQRAFCHNFVNQFKYHLYGLIVLAKWWF